jgi:hypothetical protein
MTFDIPHMIATAAIVFGAIYLTDRLSVLKRMSAGRRNLIRFGGIFVAIVLLNLVWPYGVTA